MGKRRENNLFENSLSNNENQDVENPSIEGEQTRGDQSPQEEEQTPQGNVPEEPSNDLEKALAEFPDEHITAGTQKEFDLREIDSVVNAVSNTYGIGKLTAYRAVSEIIRRGGHAVGVPTSFSIEIFCPEQRCIVTIYKRDIVRFIELSTGGRKSLKNFAHSIARSLVRMGIYRLDKDPNSDFSGDLVGI